MYSNNRKNILLWGSTGQAIVLNEFLNEIGFRVLCLFDRNENIQSPFSGTPIFHKREKLFEFTNNYKEQYFAVAIGGDGGRDRLSIHDLLTKKGMKPVTLLHPKSNIASDVIIGHGCQILINATICSRVKIGKQVIVNSSSTIDHECLLDDGVHIGPGSVLSGSVKVGKCSFIGSGSVVLPRVRIGNNTIIGAGSVVTKNMPDEVIAYGNPCRVIRKKT